jgi:hypothetical protein
MKTPEKFYFFIGNDKTNVHGGFTYEPLTTSNWEQLIKDTAQALGLEADQIHLCD